MVTTDGGAQAGEAVPTGQRIEAFRAAYNDGVYLRAAVRPARVHGALGLLLAACDERTRERDALAAQVAALTAEREEFRVAVERILVAHLGGWKADGSGWYDYYPCECGARASTREAVQHIVDCPLATTPPAGAQGDWRDAEGMFPSDEPSEVTIRRLRDEW
jgi:hypothetical protein